jgi:WD40 repeat protein
MKTITGFTVKSLTRINHFPLVIFAIATLFAVNLYGQEENNSLLLRKHSQPVKAVAFSTNGKILATGGEDKLICLWDIQTGEVSSVIQNSFGIKRLEFTKDGNLLAACGNDVKLMDIQGKTLRLWNGYTTDVWSFSYSPAAGKLVAGSYSKSIKVWDYKTASLLFTLEGHQKSALPVSFDPSGKIIVSGSLDKSVRLWDASTGKQISKSDIHSENIFAIAFHPSGKYFASASADKTIRLWSVDSSRVIRTFTGHTGAVSDVQFSIQGYHLLSCDANNKIILWETSTGKRIHIFDGHSGPVNAIRFSPDGNSFASVSDDKTTRLWKLDKKIFLQGTYFEKEIEKEIAGSPLFAPRGSDEARQDYDVRRTKADKNLQELYDQYYQKYIEMLEKLTPDQPNKQ